MILWFMTLRVMPVLWMDSGVIGFSVVPSFSFGGSGVHGFLTLEGLIVFSLSHEKSIDLLLSAGGGVGGYYHDGQGEMTPVFDCGVSFLFNRLYLRMAGVGTMKFKYFKDVDTSITVTLGYRLGNKNR